MIHSGPFSCLNDSFRLLNQNWTFTQQVACRWITTSMYKISMSYCSSKLLSVEKLFRAFISLNDSFRTIQALEWFIQGHSGAWMIHSGPFRSMNDSFRGMFWNVLSLTLRTCAGKEMLMTHKKRSETNWNNPINWKLPLRLSSMVAPETSNVLGKTLRYRESKPVQNQFSEYYSTGSAKLQ